MQFAACKVMAVLLCCRCASALIIDEQPASDEITSAQQSDHNAPCQAGDAPTATSTASNDRDHRVRLQGSHDMQVAP